MEKARDANIEAAQCKLVADSEAEVREKSSWNDLNEYYINGDK